ncbi:MAG: thioredoxin family protein [Chitinophagaceae bacterium]
MKAAFFITMFFLVCDLCGQETAQLYNHAANAEKDITGIIKKARSEKKHIFIQAGGNWCSWCIEFNRFCRADRQLDSALNADYIVYHLNYSPENRNAAVMEKYGFPQRFGFPVFLILDETGNRIHIQNSTYLEQGKSYNKRKIMEFLGQWNRKAVNPLLYKNS